MIPDYLDFTIGSMFKGTDQSPARSALLTANWRGCEGEQNPLLPFTRAREETRESRGMPDLFLNTGWVLGGKTT